MNVSKEVISGFGLMNEKFESSNVNSNKAMIKCFAALDTKSSRS
jgi:hypothetical protein